MKAFLPCFEEILRPSVVEVGSQAFTAADFGNGGFAAQTFEDDADFILGGVLLARDALDIADDLFGLRGDLWLGLGSGFMTAPEW